MAIWLQDTFTDTNGTNIASHTGENGTWSLHPVTTPRNAIIANNRIRSDVGGQYDGMSAVSSNTPPSTTFKVNFDVYVASASPTEMGCSFWWYGNTTDQDRYLVEYYVSAGAWRLYKVAGGVATLLDSYSQSLSGGVTYALEVNVSPALKTVKINGVQRLSSTDNSFTNTRVGIGLYGQSSDTVGLHIDNLVGDEPVAEQIARPDGDINTNWTASTGTNRFATVDEVTADNTDYVQSATPPAGAQEFSLTNIADPGVSTGHIVRYRYAKSAAGGAQINLTVGLYQGATLIASQTHTNISETPTDGSFTLTGTEADSITDYNDLRIRLTATQV